MGAKGRKRKAKRKAQHRAGLLRSLTSEFSTSQMDKRKKRREEPSALMKDMERKLFGGFW